MRETQLLISTKSKIFHVKENKFCSERECYNFWNPSISVQWNSLFHFVLEQNYRCEKDSQKENNVLIHQATNFLFLDSCCLLSSDFTCFVLFQIPQLVLYGKLSSSRFKVWWLKFLRMYQSISFSWPQHVFSWGSLYESCVCS